MAFSKPMGRSTLMIGMQSLETGLEMHHYG
jgi:hypothetical protein